MNLENIYQGIKNQWLNLKFEKDEEKDGVLRFQASANLGGVEDDILITIYVTNEIMSIDFIFDYLDSNIDAFKEINEFNERNLFYKAYIRHDNFFVLNYHTPIFHEEQAINEFRLAMLGMTEEIVLKPLISITNKTYKK